MTTLQTLTEGTKIGRYALTANSIVLFILGSAVLIESIQEEKQNTQVLQKKISEHYGIPPNGAEYVMCHYGKLHYPNKGIFSGYLPYYPNIDCSQMELDKIKTIS